MRIPTVSLVGFLLVGVFAPGAAHAQGGLVRKGVTELLEIFGAAGAKQGAKELSEIGGEKTVREVLERAAAQGGDDLVRQVVAFGKTGGPRALKALEGDPALMTKALRALPDGKAADAVIEAARDPSLMAKLVRTYGDDVLTASARHPGIGTQVIDEFGEAGLKAAKDLNTDQVLALAKSKGLRELPLTARNKLLGMLDRKPKEVVNALMLAAGGTAIFLTADLVNKIEDEVFGKDGEPGRLTRPVVTYSWIGGGILVAAFLAYAIIKLWGVWRRTRFNGLSL